MGKHNFHVTYLELNGIQWAKIYMKQLTPTISYRLEGTEEKLRNRESRPEDLHVIAELREMVTEREGLVKKLVVSRLIWYGIQRTLTMKSIITFFRSIGGLYLSPQHIFAPG